MFSSEADFLSKLFMPFAIRIMQIRVVKGFEIAPHLYSVKSLLEMTFSFLNYCSDS